MQTSDNQRHTERKRKGQALMAEGQCTHCRPHRGENERDSHWRWQDGKRRRIKSKEQK